jgi:nucleotide-binding universal stress UspA family protein
MPSRKILVPVDFSPISDNAVHYALGISETLNAKIIFFHADDHLDNPELKRLQSSLENKIDRAKKIKTEFISSGKLFNSETINDLFKNSIDLILLGTGGGSTHISKKLFGSNADEIVNGAKCPVLVLPPKQPFSGIKKIAYASDLTKLDEELALVISFARQFDTSIEVFHVSPVFPDLGNVEIKNVEQELTKIKQKYNYRDLHYYIEKTDRDNQLEKGIASFLNQHHSDMLVLFHNRLSGVDEFISPNLATEMILSIRTPILFFPKA